MKRLFQLWKLYAYLEFMVLIRDTRTFFTWIVSDTILNIAAVTGTLLLAVKFNGIGTWSQGQVFFLLGYAMTVSSTIDLFFNYNVSHISRRIGRGQLDHILVQPQPLWMSLLTEGFIPWSGIMFFLPGVVLLGWATVNLGMNVTPEWIFFLALNLGASCVIMLAYLFVWGSTAFWSPRAAEEICSPINSMLNKLKSYPLDSVGPTLIGGLLTVLPVGFLAWFPCRSLLGLDTTPWGRYGTSVIALGFAIVAVALFRRGLRHYYATGSQRYLSHGHRR
jgi:ABC-2 type transport system permease protein